MSDGAFESLINVEVVAEVTHPPGTTFDADGMPVPPPEPRTSSDKKEDQ